MKSDHCSMKSDHGSVKKAYTLLKKTQLYEKCPLYSVKNAGFVRKNYTSLYEKQGWEFAHSLINHSLIAHLLILSFPSNQMSDCERFAQIAQDK